MKGPLLFFIFYLFSFYSFGQFTDDNEAVLQFGRKCSLEEFQEEECFSGIIKADSISQIKNYYFTGAVFYVTIPNTYNYLMREKYGFIPYAQSDLRTSSNCCFEKRMNLLIEEKFGVNFIENVKKEADSLDKLELGYKMPTYKGKEKLFENYIYNNLEADFLKINSEDFHFLVLFEINKFGEIQNITTLSTDKTEDRLAKKVIKLMKSSAQFEPAKFNGNNVAVKYTLIINPEFSQIFNTKTEK